MKDEEYYCKKHKQFYDMYVHDCPVCFAEDLAKQQEEWKNKANKKEK